MLPALVGLFLHNGTILAYLGSRSADLVPLPFDSSTGRINRFFFEILPRVYGRFLPFLFYRWEVIMRESAILGILGLPTPGFYIDNATCLDHLDTALLLIVYRRPPQHRRGQLFTIGSQKAQDLGEPEGGNYAHSADNDSRRWGAVGCRFRGVGIYSPGS